MPTKVTRTWEAWPTEQPRLIPTPVPPVAPMLKPAQDPVEVQPWDLDDASDANMSEYSDTNVDLVQRFAETMNTIVNKTLLTSIATQKSQGLAAISPILSRSLDAAMAHTRALGLHPK